MPLVSFFQPDKRGTSMCYKCDNPEMAGLHAGHLPLLQEAMTKQSDLARDLFQALTATLNPHLPILPALLAMAEAVERQDFGVLAEHRLVRLPLSIIGNDKVRYRTQTVEHLHETVLSARMSEITMEAVRKALRPHGLCILFLCSCGVVLGKCPDVLAYYGSDAHVRMDRLRSAIDASGNPVRKIESFTDIMVPTMDLHQNGAEERLFARISELTKIASQAGHTDYHWIERELRSFTDQAHPLLAVA
jgi:hypothetical protein